MGTFDAAHLSQLVRGKLRAGGKQKLVETLKLPDKTKVSWEDGAGRKAFTGVSSNVSRNGVRRVTGLVLDQPVRPVSGPGANRQFVLVPRS